MSVFFPEQFSTPSSWYARNALVKKGHLRSLDPRLGGPEKSRSGSVKLYLGHSSYGVPTSAESVLDYSSSIVSIGTRFRYISQRSSQVCRSPPGKLFSSAAHGCLTSHPASFHFQTYAQSPQGVTNNFMLHWSACCVQRQLFSTLWKLAGRKALRYLAERRCQLAFWRP